MLLKTFGITTLSTFVFEVTFILLDWSCTFANLSWGIIRRGVMESAYKTFIEFILHFCKLLRP